MSGAPTEDVLEIMDRFRARIQLLSTVNCISKVVDQRAMKYLPLLVNEAAAETMNQVVTGSLEWPSCRQSQHTSDGISNGNVELPKGWAYWVNEFTSLFAPANPIVLLVCE